MAAALVPRMRVSCVVRSLSAGWNSSHATTLMPAAGAWAFSTSRALTPKAPVSLSMAMSLMPFFLKKSSSRATTSTSFTVDLNTYGRSLTGSTSAVAPDTLMSGTLARCTVGMMARPMSLRLPSPTITSTLSCSMSRLAASTALDDSLAAS